MLALKLFFGLFFAVLLTGGSAAFAQQFSGQPATMIVNYSAGGPTDIEARIVARHLPKYLQGVSAVIVRNVGGAGGNIGVNQLGEASARDRLNISFFTWDPVDQLIQHESLRVKYNDLKFIAGFKMASLVYMRRDTPPGITKSSDMARAPLFRMGALSPTNHSTIRMRLVLDLLGAKYEPIAGYKGTREIETAVRQGDIQFTFTSLPGWFASVKPVLIDTGIAMPLFQFDSLRADGSSAGRSPDLPDVPAFLEAYRDVWGKDATPSGDKWLALQMLTRIMDSLYRTVFMPPNAPAAAVAEMRSAMERLESDAEFIADYEKVVKTKPRFILGAEGERIIAELGNVQPSFLGFLREYIKMGK
jgi:tripartite-type tricarboxylate transporter receptor subunit TctC